MLRAQVLLRSRHARVLGAVLVVAAWWVYVAAPPLSPDLAAQVARARAAELTGSSQWWTGWFGGLALPSYSTISPWLMAFAGAPATGATASVVALVAAALLLTRTPRPALGVLAFAALDAGDLLVGRVTFAVGLALGLLALVVLVRGSRRPSALAAAGCAAAACLASPLAGLFTGLVAVAVAVTDRPRRRRAGLTATTLLVCGGLLGVLYPGTGTMPTPLPNVLPALGAAVVVALVCRQPAVRTAAVLAAVATVAFTVVPGAVGLNITRLAWVGATPVVLACAQVPRRLEGASRAWRGVVVVVLAAATAVAPTFDVLHQLSCSRDPSTSAAFYAPLVKALEADRAAHPQQASARVEVVDPRTHWSSVYVAARVPMARGWDRQADAAYNPIFYTPGALDAASYTAWLRSMAVGWVAVPRVRLDYASVAEGRLITHGVPALRPLWRSRSWTLYRVADPTPVVQGARLVSVDPSGANVDLVSPAVVTIRVRWSPSLVAVPEDAVADGLVPPRPGVSSGSTAASATPLMCPVPSADGMVVVPLPPGRWRIAPDLAGDLEHRWVGSCAQARELAMRSTARS